MHGKSRQIGTRWFAALALLAAALAVALPLLHSGRPCHVQQGAPVAGVTGGSLPKVAVSYLMNEHSTLNPLQTLLGSDITSHAQLAIYAFSNSPGAPATAEYQELLAGRQQWRWLPSRAAPPPGVLLTVADVRFDQERGWNDPRPQCSILNGTTNLGIVLPRMRIMVEVGG